VLDLDALFPEPPRMTDEYLWVPDRPVNVKLRSGGNGSVKFKWLERSAADAIELWIEREQEEYHFPISPEVAVKIGQALSVTVSPPPEALTRHQLLDLLRRSDPRIQIVVVDKSRTMRIAETRYGRVLIELTDITRPEVIGSVSVEDGSRLSPDASEAELAIARLAVAAAVGELPLATVKPMNYVTAIGIWVRGASIGV
jgi:hypothetical protein